jgi:uncharacterized membrane protein YphA (DoxX/SURF4 family)
MALLFLIPSTLLILGAITESAFPDIFAFYELFSDRWPFLWRYDLHIAAGELFLACLLLIPAFRINKKLSQKYVETALRLGIGAMFIGASLFKMQDPKAFASLTAQYQFLPHFMVNSFSLFLPALEFLVGIAIILTSKTRENALLISLMFVAFIVALAWAVGLDLGITCGCFELEGATDKKGAWLSLVRDLILLPPCLWLCFRPNHSLIGVWRS